MQTDKEQKVTHKVGLNAVYKSSVTISKRLISLHERAKKWYEPLKAGYQWF
jgi:hypothetical protein